MGFLTKQDSSSTSKPSYWQTPDGKWGKWALVLIGGLAAVGFVTKLLPMLTAFVSGAADLTMALARLGLIAGTIAIVVAFLMRPEVRTMLFYWFRGLISFAKNGYISRNFVQIMRTYVENGREKLIDLSSNLRNLNRQKGIQDESLRQRHVEVQKLMSDGLNIQKRLETETDEDIITDLKRMLSSIAGKIGDYKESIAGKEASIKRLVMMLKVIKKMEGITATLVDRLHNKVEMKISDYQMATEANKAVKSAWDIAYGDGEGKEFYNRAMETISDQTGAKIGDIEMMMEDFKSIMLKQDLDNMAFEEVGMKAIEEWEAKHESRLTDFTFLDKMPDLKAVPQTVKVSAKAEDTTDGNSTAGKWLK